jgi:hypothetical protein
MLQGFTAPPGFTADLYTGVFCCGFECGRLGSAGLHWPTATNTSIDTGTVRSGARSYRVNPTAGTGSASPNGVSAAAITVMRFYVYFATLPSADTFIAWVAGASTSRVGIAFKQSDSKLYCASGSSPAFGATGVTVTTGTWYRIDLTMDQTSGAKSVDAQVDGAALGQKTIATVSGNFPPSIGVANTCTADVFFDDVAISNTSADYPIGVGFVNHFVPTSDGTHNVAGANQFERGTTGTDIDNSTTTAYQLVDDIPLDDTTPDADDYISAIAPANATDYVEVVIGPAPGISVPTNAPRHVEAIVATHQAATTTGNWRVALSDNGTTDDIGNFTGAGVTTIKYTRKAFAVPPTGGAWSLSGPGNFNDLRMRFYSSDALPDQYWDAAMIEAEFQQ